jgi:hypothetical protein
VGVSTSTCSSGVITLIGKLEHLGPSDDLLGMWRHLASQVYVQGIVNDYVLLSSSDFGAERGCLE